MNDLTAGIENSEIHVALHRLRLSLAGIEFLLPDMRDSLRNIGVVTVTVPRSHNEWLQLFDDRRIDQGGPPDLRRRRSAMSAGDVTVLGMDYDQNNRPVLGFCPFESKLQ